MGHRCGAADASPRRRAAPAGLPVARQLPPHLVRQLGTMGVRRAGSGGLAAPGAETGCGAFQGAADAVKSLPYPAFVGLATVFAPVTHVGGWVLLSWLRGDCSAGGLARSQAQDALSFLDLWRQNRAAVAGPLSFVPVAGPVAVQVFDGIANNAQARAFLEQMAGIKAPASSSSTSSTSKDRARAEAQCKVILRQQLRRDPTSAEVSSCADRREGNTGIRKPARQSSAPAPAPAPSSEGSGLALGLGALLLLGALS